MQEKEPWYKKWGLAILAGLTLIVTGFIIALTGGKKGRKVHSIEKRMRDIHDDQLSRGLEENVRSRVALEEEKKKLSEQVELAHKKINDAPRYDGNLSDKDNLEKFKNTKW